MQPAAAQRSPQDAAWRLRFRQKWRREQLRALSGGASSPGALRAPPCIPSHLLVHQASDHSWPSLPYRQMVISIDDINNSLGAVSRKRCTSISSCMCRGVGTFRWLYTFERSYVSVMHVMPFSFLKRWQLLATRQSGISSPHKFCLPMQTHPSPPRRLQ